MGGYLLLAKLKIKPSLVIGKVPIKTQWKASFTWISHTEISSRIDLRSYSVQSGFNFSHKIFDILALFWEKYYDEYSNLLHF